MLQNDFNSKIRTLQLFEKKKNTDEFQQLYLLFTRIYKIGIINTLMDLGRFVGFVSLQNGLFQ